MVLPRRAAAAFCQKLAGLKTSAGVLRTDAGAATGGAIHDAAGCTWAQRTSMHARARASGSQASTPPFDMNAFLRTPTPYALAVGLLGSAWYGYRLWQGPELGETRVYMDFESEGQPLGRVVMRLYEKAVPPQIVENFVGLATHERGYGYSGSPVHQVVPGYCLMAGDIIKGDGSGGVSVFGPEFIPRLPELRHTRGTVSMVVADGGAVRSQFFVAAMPMAPEIDREMLAFGRVVEGMNVVDAITRAPSDPHTHVPHARITVSACGTLPQAERV